MSDTENGLQKQLTALNNWSVKWSLQLNCDKTKVMHIKLKSSSRSDTVFKMGNETIKYTSRYRYLGLTISPYDNIERLQYRAIRTFMGVGKCIPIQAICGDMGWTPAYIRRQCNMIKLWHRIASCTQVEFQIIFSNGIQHFQKIIGKHDKTIIACAILHHICILFNEPDINDDRVVIGNDGDLGERFIADPEGRAIRDHISFTFLNR
ncbi:unnamed protein product [Mytilus coruscus]|uniref:HARBI1 n=1 Tax=Mytilus coruscus TaxID=42192 RepID=A0A6J8A8H1_MYTCO|nr:unnamed protein product [Mytilus coruscus]